MTKVFWQSVGVFVMFLACLGAATLGLAIADRQPPIFYESGKAESQEIWAGGTIGITFTVFRYRLCDSTAERWLIDSTGLRHSIPQFTSRPRPFVGDDSYSRTITVPESAAPGPAVYQVEIRYYCNLVHRLFDWPVLVVSPPVTFHVLPRPLILIPVDPPKPDTDG